MRVAIYTRKSVYSDNSESVKNQARMCREYVSMHFPSENHDFTTYEDEAYTGADVQRPSLQLLLETIKSDAVDLLIVYQLDRLSRDVKDFTDIYGLLSEHGVQFASVKENIDTSTPIGESMMYILVVFAQMERKTIAMRVYDNMYGLAGSGWWVGGNPPFGYRRVKVTEAGKNHTSIEVVPDQAERVRWFFTKFLELGGSLQTFETYCKHNGIRTPRGSFFSASQLHQLLRMPYCVPADHDVYDYYESLGCQLKPSRDHWDGSTGVIIYGRTTQKNKKHVLTTPDKWLVVPGKHEAFIDSETWLAVQAQFNHNVYIKKPRIAPPLLKGVLRCSCGRLMNVAHKKRVDGSYTSWYKCPKRERMGPEACSMGHIKCDLLDSKVLQVFNSVALDPNCINEYADDINDSVDISASLSILNKEIQSIENKIERLTESLALSESGAASRHIVRSIDKLDSELIEKNNELTRLKISNRVAQENKKATAETAAVVRDLINNFDNFDAFERNEIAVKCIKRCTWDGDTLFLTL